MILSDTQTLHCQSLRKSFKRRMVVHDVSVNLTRGEVVGLLGPNGAGKTTCFYMIMGLIPPDAGRIILDDLDITRVAMHHRARLGIGYLPQEPSVFRGLNVEDNIRAVLEYTRFDKEEQEAILEELLGEFSLTHLRFSPSLALSGGERRRLEIARALAVQPSFILLDEPLAGIDPIAVQSIRDLIHQLKKRGIGVLITDHNVRDTLKIVDRVYIIHEGHVLIEGTPEMIANHPDTRRFYLGESFSL